MELPPCNLHSLIIPRTPIPFNYNRCLFWLIVCLLSGVLLVLMHSSSRRIQKSPLFNSHLLRAPGNEQNKYIVLWCGLFNVQVFVVLKCVCLSLRVCPALLVRRERMETSERWWALVSLLQEFTLFARTTWWGGKSSWLFWGFWPAAEFGNSIRHLADVF